MHRFEETRSVRIRVLGIAAALIVMAGAVSSSCAFDLRFDRCELAGLHCREGQECAANQIVCIEIGGCGNGLIDTGEVCDDGNILDGVEDETGAFVADACNRDCTSTQVCGNGIRDTGEECDEGKCNGDAGGSCDSACRRVSRSCGNGMVDPGQGEECDPGPMDSSTCNSNMACPASCKISQCGDGYTNAAAGEQCDLLGGSDTSTCNGKNAGVVRCRISTCGDGYMNSAAAEQCESNSDCSAPRLCMGCQCI
jgi:hypothetical protein